MSEWSTLKLSTVAQLITKGATPTTYGHEYTESGIAFVRVNNILENGQLDLSKSLFIGKTTHALFSRSQLHVNDVLVSIAGSIGRTTVVDAAVLPANCNQAVALIRLEPDFDPSYVARLLASNIGRAQITAATVQLAQANFSLKQVGDLEFNFPPHSEQKSIAKVIDCIDMTICQTEAIIEKLKLVKQGLQHDLLTRGIDANGELRPPQSQAPQLYKDSPLGWIPMEWDALQFSTLAQYTNGNTFDAGSWRSQGLPIIRIQNLNGSNNFNYFDGPVNSRWHVLPGDLLFAWSGQRGISFGPRIWSGPNGVLNQHIFKVIEKYGVISKDFLFEVLRFRQSVIEDSAHGFKDSFLHVTRGELGAVFAGIPLPAEQSMIVTRIAVFEAKLNEERAILAKNLALKTGLMDDLLTGSVRVTQLLDTVDA